MHPKTFRNFLLLFLVVFSALLADKTCEQISEYVFKNLPEYGQLKQDDLGFVYVDVDDAYINKLIPFLSDEGFEKPSYFGPGFHGAHISVIYVDEAFQHHVGEIAEIGSTIYFKIRGCKIVEPPQRPGEFYYVLIVDAPNLNRLRKKYGLRKSKYDFHITIGKKQLAEEMPESIPSAI